MTNPREHVQEFYKKVAEDKAKAVAAGYVPPDGTYTFTNKEAFAVAISLHIVELLVKGEKEGILIAQFLTMVLRDKEQEVNEILSRLNKEIREKQSPPYVSENAALLVHKVRESSPTFS